jgi:hypothetical protein
MESPSKHQHDFPMHFALKGRMVILRPLMTDDREPLVRFGYAARNRSRIKTR